MNAVKLCAIDARLPTFTRVFLLNALMALACPVYSFSYTQTTDSVKPSLAPEVFDWR